MTTHHQKVVGQFDPVATAYLTSAVHAQGEDLAYVAKWVQSKSNALVLDLGCGAGHLSFAMAPHVQQVTAYDLSPSMLLTVSETAKERGLSNIVVEQGRTEKLPFEDASFDVVCTRYSAHHWSDLPQALSEMRRVLKADGIAMIIDVVAPDRALLDTFLQAVELLRDTSHVRDLSISDWKKQLVQAGFNLGEEHGWKLPIDFDSWVARMRTPADYVAVIRSLLSHAPEEVREYFSVDENSSFSIDAHRFELTAH